jgi:hypothetical protein
MIRRVDVSVGLLVAGFIFVFLGSFFGLLLASYLAGVFLVLSLFLHRHMSPHLGFCVVLLSLLLALLSPSPYMIAAVFPLVGIFFSGRNRYPVEIPSKTRYALFLCVSIIYALFVVIRSEAAGASHNQLSVFIAYALIAEVLYFGRPARYYMVLIFISFFLFGNRSSLFLLAAYIRNKFLLMTFVLISILFLSFTSGLLDPPDYLVFLFENGGLFYRSYRETRADYLDEFIQGFNLYNLAYDRWTFSDVPQTASGFYDLHNSFLTVIIRDSYLGILKLLLWAITMFYLSVGVFLAVTLRAFYDTFLLGGVLDVMVYALIGRAIISSWRLVRDFLSRYFFFGFRNQVKR